MNRCWLGLVLLLGGVNLHAQESDSGGTVPAEDLKQTAIDSVRGYEIRAAVDPESHFQLVPEPVVRFNTSSIDEGDVLLWTRSGRPQAAVQVFRLNTASGYIWLHEFQSLSAEAILLERDGQTLWNPASAGMTWHDLTAKAAPARAAPARLTQIKQHARRFTGQEQTPGLAGGDMLKNFELRQKPREIHRYEAPAQGIIDGVVFYFAQEDQSDPELLLLIEAHETDGKQGWRFACAPLSCWPMQLALDGQEVVNIPNRYLKSRADEPYHIWSWRPDGQPQ